MVSRIADSEIDILTPANPQGKWDVRVINPGGYEAVMQGGFLSIAELVYNYPNPFKASQGTTFRYVTNSQLQSVTVKVFNLAGVPVDIIQQTGSNEVAFR